MTCFDAFFHKFRVLSVWVEIPHLGWKSAKICPKWSPYRCTFWSAPIHINLFSFWGRWMDTLLLCIDTHCFWSPKIFFNPRLICSIVYLKYSFPTLHNVLKYSFLTLSLYGKCHSRSPKIISAYPRALGTCELSIDRQCTCFWIKMNDVG